jgi:Tat protein translocase TatB subunit
VFSDPLQQFLPNFWFVLVQVTIRLQKLSSSLSGKVDRKTVVFLILESLGSTELLFILVMALVFFGPRKLPQLSRSLGKSMAEFRRASDDFKRTWEREVNLEELTADVAANPTPSYENSIMDPEGASHTLQSPTIEAVAADQVIPREPSQIATSQLSDSSEFAADEAEPPRKRDWL